MLSSLHQVLRAVLGDLQGRGNLQSRMLAAKPHLQRQPSPVTKPAEAVTKMIQNGFSIIVANPAHPLLIELLNILHRSDAAGPSLVRDEQIQRGLSQVGVCCGGTYIVERPL